MTFTMAGSTDACKKTWRISFKHVRLNVFPLERSQAKQMYLHHPPGHQLPVHSHQAPILERCDPESPHWDHLHSRQVDVLPEDGHLLDPSSWHWSSWLLTRIPSWEGTGRWWTFVLFCWGRNLAWKICILLNHLFLSIFFWTWLWKETSLRHWAWTKGRKRCRRQCRTEKKRLKRHTSC